jgi:hypothetical protein
MKALSKGGKFSKTDFADAYAAAGVLMAAADGDIAESEVAKISARMKLHPIISTLSESKRTEMLNTCIEMAEVGMIVELVQKVERLADPLYTPTGQLKDGLAQEDLDEIQDKADSIITMVISIKDDDATTTEDEAERLECIAFWLARMPEGLGLRDDLLENPPAYAANLLRG